MTVKRIVANIAAGDLQPVKAFYRDLFGLGIVMDHGWIVTLASAAACRPELSVAIEGGSGTPVPDISIEVDDVDETYQRAVAAVQLNELLAAVSSGPTARNDSSRSLFAEQGQQNAGPTVDSSPRARFAARFCERS